MAQWWSENSDGEGQCYAVLPRPHPGSPGFGGLTVTLHPFPIDSGSGAETLYLCLRDEAQMASWRMLRWRGEVESPAFVCAGRIVLCERSDRRIAFFSFGGELRASFIPDRTIYEIRSEAPVLGVTFPSGMLSVQLASEAEALLAEIKVRWEPDEEGFSRLLARLDPLACYRGVLQSLHARFEHVAPLQDTLPPLSEIVHREREWLKETGRWPPDCPTIEELLSPIP